MIPRLEEIKEIRKKLNLTQAQLAKRANVSQSLIAKIESGKIDPAYSNIVKIFNALRSMEKKQELRAKNIMHNKIISISVNDEIKNAVKKMKKYDISQLPVIEGNNCVGLVSETLILEALFSKKGKIIKDVMDDPPPIISKNTPITVISSLLKYFPLVLVSDNGNLKGVITKSDLLTSIYKS